MTKLNYVNGEWVSGSKVTLNINPSDLSDVVGEYASADIAQTRAAIEAAARAAPLWRDFPLQDRANLLDKVGAAILARKDELGTLLAREEGKTLPEAIGEVVRAGNIFKFFGAEVLRAGGVVLPSVRSGMDVVVTREPIGVVGLITPWNFPMAIPAWKIAPALAYGNCVVFKPAELVPGCGWEITRLLADAGIPPGVFNLVMGPGSQVGNELVENPAVQGISFTGSVGVGRRIAAQAIAGNKKLQLEMGGKNPLVILGDANLDHAVECAVNGAFYSTGQRCTASSRIIATDDVHDEVVRRISARIAALKVGPALDAATQIGPVVDARQLANDEDYIRIGQDEGARLAVGGKRVQCATEGFFLSPALFVDTDPAMRINREEIFGPVASMQRARNYEHALELANDTQFGLSSGICTTSLKYATHFQRYAQAGLVMVNAPTAGIDYHVPFGGTKGSSYGSREQGSFAAEFYTKVKTSYVAA